MPGDTTVKCNLCVCQRDSDNYTSERLLCVALVLKMSSRRVVVVKKDQASSGLSVRFDNMR
jgi:hypothetical protein